MSFPFLLCNNVATLASSAIFATVLRNQTYRIFLTLALILWGSFTFSQEWTSLVYSDTSFYYTYYPPDSGQHGAWNLPIVDISIEDHEDDDDHEEIDTKEVQLNNRKNLSGLLEKISGLNTISSSSRIGKPVLHGMYGNRLAIINNGTRLESQQWGIEHAPEISVSNGGKIEVLKGAHGVIYGPEAIAGVILIHPYELPQKEGISSSIWSSAFSNGQGGSFGGEIVGMSQLRIPLAWRVTGNILRSGDNMSPIGVLTNTGSFERSMGGSLSTRFKNIVLRYDGSVLFSKTGIFSGSHFSNLTDLNAILNGTKQVVSEESPFSYLIQGPFQSTQHSSHITSLDWIVNNHSELEIITSYQSNRRKEFEAHGEDDIDLDLKLETLSSKITYSIFSDSTELLLGGEFKQQTNVYKERAFIPNMIQNAGGAFAFYEMKGNTFSFNGGARLDFIDLNAYQNISGTILQIGHSFLGTSIQAEGTYKINEHSHLSFKGGRAWRAPNLAELYANGVHHGAASIEVGNILLSQETVWESSASLHFNKGNLDLEVSPYYNYFENYIYLKPSGVSLTILGAFPVYNYTNTRAHFYGFDLFAKYKFSKRLNASTNTSLVNAYDLGQDTYLPFIPPFSTTNTLSYNIGSLDKKTCKVSLKTKSVLSQMRYSVVNELASPPPSFFLIDLSVQKEYNNLTLQCELLNLFKTDYRNYLSRLRYFAPNPGRSLEISLLWKLTKK